MTIETAWSWKKPNIFGAKLPAQSRRSCR